MLMKINNRTLKKGRIHIIFVAHKMRRRKNRLELKVRLMKSRDSKEDSKGLLRINTYPAPQT